MDQITFDEFQKVEMRVGRVLEAIYFAEARDPAFKLKIDFGPEVGVKWSSSQIAYHYKKEDLEGRLVIGVLNLPVKKVANFESQVLTLGFYDQDGKVVLAIPERDVPLGERLS